MFTITAYDKDHNILALDMDSADGDLQVDTYGGIISAYTRTSANVIDAETGEATRRTRRIAYFRVYTDGICFEIYATRYGRQAAVRNYQMRRPSDVRAVHIDGYAPIHTAPRMERRPGYSQGTWVLVVGEGNPYMIDQSGDTGVIIAEAIRCTRNECGWSGWSVNETFGKERKLPGATMSTVKLAFKEAELHYNNR